MIFNMNKHENINRKENGIIFQHEVFKFNESNIALFNSKCPNYLKWFTNNGIVIKETK